MKTKKQKPRRQLTEQERAQVQALRIQRAQARAAAAKLREEKKQARAAAITKLHALASAIPPGIGEWGSYRVRAWKHIREECERRSRTFRVSVDRLQVSIDRMMIAQEGQPQQIADMLDDMGVRV